MAEDLGGLGYAYLMYEADTVFPTVIVIDEPGTVVFSDQTDDYRVRPEPALFIAHSTRRITNELPHQPAVWPERVKVTVSTSDP